MWLLSCHGDHFAGKRFWLRPGTTHLLGRTTGQAENGERIRHIDQKSVSRKHLTIEVVATGAENVTKIFAKSEVKLKDGSKIGTTINGDKINQEEKTLSGGEREAKYTIKLGNYEHLFYLTWRPLVFSLSYTGTKTRQPALAAHREKFQQTGVKVVSEYITNVTTHCVAKKRNTVPVLQALLQGKWLVTDDYVEAVAVLMKRSGPTSESVLEDDFDANWPKEPRYPVPPGKEVNPRDEHYLLPKSERSEIFHNFAFVFLSQTQYDQLLPVVTAGGGKAFPCVVDPDVRNTEDVISFISSVADNKRTDKADPSRATGKGGIVVIRMQEGDEALRKLNEAIDLALNQRSVQQSELLDPILMLDTTSLTGELPEVSQSSAVPGNSRSQSQAYEPPQSRSADVEHSRNRNQPPQEASEPTTSRPHAQRQPPEERRRMRTSNSPAAEQQAPETSQAPEETPPSENAAAVRKRARRVITQSRFKGFDDFDPSQFTKPASQSPEPSFDQPEFSQAQSVQNMDVDEPSQAVQTQQSSRKRAAPSLEEQEKQMMDDMLTGHNTMKRRKLASGVKDEDTVKVVESDRLNAEKSARAKKKAKEMDVMAEITARRKRDEDERKKDEESLREAMNGIDIAELKNLAQVEEMDVPVRERPARGGAAEGGGGDRWDPAWNGRKNFKKFRRQGQRDGDAPRLPRVIVALEEVPKKAHGIGEEYWLTSTSKTKGKGKNQSQSQSQSQSTRQSQRTNLASTVADSSRFQERLKESHREDHDTADIDEILPDEIAGHARDETLEATANANASTAYNSTPSQTLGTDSQRRAAGKRQAAEQTGPPAKKARQSQRAPSSRQPVTIDDDDDDDALKFRRRRK
ncbi:hypothetical protein LTR09_001131 [Extremus antarcticus]|uniref:FHA domain-containing protein n=1 Tax=Extremus antarcticus TaxID=702011 RepID=A0AAJ0LWL1_9PEZI|nr:hypothetical protein LTR09_001131 [Extremus antarcticus]